MTAAPTTGALLDVIRGELVHLWRDLSFATRCAHNGQWSMECDHLVSRIATLTAYVGPCPDDQVAMTLIYDGTYQRLHAEMGITVKPFVPVGPAQLHLADNG